MEEYHLALGLAIEKALQECTGKTFTAEDIATSVLSRNPDFIALGVSREMIERILEQSVNGLFRCKN